MTTADWKSTIHHAYTNPGQLPSPLQKAIPSLIKDEIQRLANLTLFQTNVQSRSNISQVPVDMKFTDDSLNIRISENSPWISLLSSSEPLSLEEKAVDAVRRDVMEKIALLWKGGGSSEESDSGHSSVPESSRGRTRVPERNRSKRSRRTEKNKRINNRKEASTVISKNKIDSSTHITNNYYCCAGSHSDTKEKHPQTSAETQTDSTFDPVFTYKNMPEKDKKTNSSEDSSSNDSEHGSTGSFSSKSSMGHESSNSSNDSGIGTSEDSSSNDSEHGSTGSFSSKSSMGHESSNSSNDSGIGTSEDSSSNDSEHGSTGSFSSKSSMGHESSNSSNDSGIGTSEDSSSNDSEHGSTGSFSSKSSMGHESSNSSNDSGIGTSEDSSSNDSEHGSTGSFSSKSSMGHESSNSSNDSGIGTSEDSSSNDSEHGSTGSFSSKSSMGHESSNSSNDSGIGTSEDSSSNDSEHGSTGSFSSKSSMGHESSNSSNDSGIGTSEDSSSNDSEHGSTGSFSSKSSMGHESSNSSNDSGIGTSEDSSSNDSEHGSIDFFSGESQVSNNSNVESELSYRTVVGDTSDQISSSPFTNKKIGIPNKESNAEPMPILHPTPSKTADPLAEIKAFIKTHDTKSKPVSHLRAFIELQIELAQDKLNLAKVNNLLSILKADSLRIEIEPPMKEKSPISSGDSDINDVERELSAGDTPDKISSSLFTNKIGIPNKESNIEPMPILPPTPSEAVDPFAGIKAFIKTYDTKSKPASHLRALTELQFELAQNKPNLAKVNNLLSILEAKPLQIEIELPTEVKKSVSSESTVSSRGLEKLKVFLEDSIVQTDAFIEIANSSKTEIDPQTTSSLLHNRNVLIDVQNLLDSDSQSAINSHKANRLLDQLNLDTLQLVQDDFDLEIPYINNEDSSQIEIEIPVEVKKSVSSESTASSRGLEKLKVFLEDSIVQTDAFIEIANSSKTEIDPQTTSSLLHNRNVLIDVQNLLDSDSQSAINSHKANRLLDQLNLDTLQLVQDDFDLEIPYINNEDSSQIEIEIPVEVKKSVSSESTASSRGLEKLKVFLEDSIVQTDAFIEIANSSKTEIDPQTTSSLLHNRNVLIDVQNLLDSDSQSAINSHKANRLLDQLNLDTLQLVQDDFDLEIPYINNEDSSQIEIEIPVEVKKSVSSESTASSRGLEKLKVFLEDSIVQTDAFIEIANSSKTEIDPQTTSSLLHNRNVLIDVQNLLDSDSQSAINSHKANRLLDQLNLDTLQLVQDDFDLEIPYINNEDSSDDKSTVTGSVIKQLPSKKIDTSIQTDIHQNEEAELLEKLQELSARFAHLDQSISLTLQESPMTNATVQTDDYQTNKEIKLQKKIQLLSKKYENLAGTILKQSKIDEKQKTELKELHFDLTRTRHELVDALRRFETLAESTETKFKIAEDQSEYIRGLETQMQALEDINENLIAAMETLKKRRTIPKVQEDSLELQFIGKEKGKNDFIENKRIENDPVSEVEANDLPPLSLGIKTLLNFYEKVTTDLKNIRNSNESQGFYRKYKESNVISDLKDLANRISNLEPVINFALPTKEEIDDVSEQIKRLFLQEEELDNAELAELNEDFNQRLKIYNELTLDLQKIQKDKLTLAELHHKYADTNAIRELEIFARQERDVEPSKASVERKIKNLRELLIQFDTNLESTDLDF